MRDFLINAGLVVASILVFFGGAEVAARIAWPGGDNLVTCAVPHPRLIWARKPNCQAFEHNPESVRVEYVLDSCAQRNVVPCDKVPANALRIAAIGDSMTEGALVHAEEMFANVAARRLERPDRPAAVLNFGVGGWDMLQYFERLDDALAAKPDIVVLGLVSNDLFDDPSPEGLERQRERIRREGVERMMEVRVNQWKHENLQATLRTWINMSRALLIVQHMLFRSDSVYFAVYRARGATGNYLARDYAPEWQRRVDGAALLLQAMDAKARATGARFVVVMIPQRVQAVMLSMQGLAQEFDPGGLQRRVRDKATGVEFVDFFDVLKGVGRPTHLYFPVDGHLTAEGHRLLGEALARKLGGPA
jgi:lysophospholipase L1-like esterase